MRLAAKHLRRLLLFFATVALRCPTTKAANTRIVLDPTTFPPISRPLLQETADQVAKAVDELIPGDYPNNRRVPQPRFRR